MTRENTAVIIGHRECYGVDEGEIAILLKELIQQGVTCFLNGGMGGFDLLCARIGWEWKRTFPQVQQFLVIPYLTFSVPRTEYFDEIIYPEGLEKYHFKSAIQARNRYMVDHAGYAICYVRHSWGGAAQTYEYAIQKQCSIIHIQSKTL